MYTIRCSVSITLYITFIKIGALSGVGFLTKTISNTTLTLTWAPPFTLDIIGIYPDIAGYCVDVVNAASLAALHSECNITRNQFTYTIPPKSQCYGILFSVTPVNIVGRGQTTMVAYFGAQNRK